MRAFAVLLHAVAREMAPLRIGERTERRADVAHVGLDFVYALEAPPAGDVALHAKERAPRDERADVVQHQAPDRRAGLRREEHADEAPHRGADPIEFHVARTPPEPLRPRRRGGTG